MLDFYHKYYLSTYVRHSLLVGPEDVRAGRFLLLPLRYYQVYLLQTSAKTLPMTYKLAMYILDSIDFYP